MFGKVKGISFKSKFSYLQMHGILLSRKKFDEGKYLANKRTHDIFRTLKNRQLS